MRASILVSAVLLASTHAFGACPLPAFNGTGDGTFYYGSGIGNCTIEFTDADPIAAINAPQWGGSVHCGECVLVTGPLGSIRVKIVDQCPECLAGDLDMSPSAFAAIANPIDGRAPISWSRVECPVSGGIDYRFQGSNDFYVKLQALDHRVGVASMALRESGSMTFVPMPRVDDNFFEKLFPGGLHYPVEVRTTATTGQAVSQSFPGIVNNTIIVGTPQFDGCEALFADSFE